MPQSMKITTDTDLPAILSSKPLNPSPDSDLLHKPRKSLPRKARNLSFSGAGVRLRGREGAPSGRRSRPETPLLKWKFEDKGESKKSSGRKLEVPVSARKIAAGLWRVHLLEVPTDAGDWCSLPKKDRLGSQVQ